MARPTLCLPGSRRSCDGPVPRLVTTNSEPARRAPVSRKSSVRTSSGKAAPRDAQDGHEAHLVVVPVANCFDIGLADRCIAHKILCSATVSASGCRAAGEGGSRQRRCLDGSCEVHEPPCAATSRHRKLDPSSSGRRQQPTGVVRGRCHRGGVRARGRWYAPAPQGAVVPRSLGSGATAALPQRDSAATRGSARRRAAADRPTR